MVEPALLRSVLDTARTASGRVAVVEPGRETTYGTLVSRTEGLANRLREQGVSPGCRVAAVLPPGADLVSVALAAFRLGAAYVPVDPALPARRIEQILRVCSPAAVVRRRDSELDVASATPGAAGLDVAYVISTSGSTGAPKAVEIEHRSLLNTISDIDRHAPTSGPHTGSWWTSPTFDVSLWECWSPLAASGTVAVVPAPDRLDAVRFGTFLDSHRIASAYVPPGLLYGLRDFLASDLRLARDLTRILVGVEPLPLGLLQDLMRDRPGLRVVNGYGPAEATICCTLYRVPRSGGRAADRTPIGTAVRGNTVYVRDGSGRLHTSGAGELVVTGVNVGRRYLDGDPDGRFLPDPQGRAGIRAYRTGDLARFLPDGNLVFEGRTDRQFKIRGQRIEAGEVESAIREAVPVREVVVDVRDGPQLAAYLVAEPDRPVNGSDLRRALLDVLPPAAVPAVVRTVEELPLTPNGKTDYAALARLDVDASEPIGNARADESWIALSAAVRGTLGTAPDPGRTFLECGGNSLSAVQVVVALRDSTGREVSSFDVLAADSLGRLADSLVTCPLAETRSSAGLGRSRGPLTPAQLSVWMHDQWEPDSTRYLESYCAELSGVPDDERLRSAVARAAAAHPAFTSVIVDDGDEVTMHLFAREIRLAVTRVADRGDALAAAADLLRRPMDLAAGPLMRAHWLTYAQGRGLLVLVWHHLVIDGWSLRLFLADLGRCYARPEFRPAPAEMTICDANVRATSLPAIAAEVEATVLRFPPGVPLTWPLRGDRTTTGPAERLLAELPPDRSAAVRKAAGRSGRSPLVELLAIFQYALARRYGLETFVVGCADGRGRRPDEANVAGYMVDTRLLVADGLRGRSADDYLPAAAASAAQVLDRPAPAPLPAVIRQLRRSRDVPDSFPSFYYIADEDYVLDLAGVHCREVELTGSQAKFDVTLGVRHAAGRFALRLTWDSGIVPDGEPAALLAEILSTIDAVAQHV